MSEESCFWDEWRYMWNHQVHENTILEFYNSDIYQNFLSYLGDNPRLLHEKVDRSTSFQDAKNMSQILFRFLREYLELETGKVFHLRYAKMTSPSEWRGGLHVGYHFTAAGEVNRTDITRIMRTQNFRECLPGHYLKYWKGYWIGLTVNVAPQWHREDDEFLRMLIYLQNHGSVKDIAKWYQLKLGLNHAETSCI